ncbi:MAG TPA: hypothetical protein ENJ82_05040 [Bacteroidetes bacterium]|nr:hypothetical protein [Bacteroidota bacterium]
MGNSFISQHGNIRFEQVARKKLSVEAMPGQGWIELKEGKGAVSAYSLDHELAHICANLPFHGPFKENSLLVHFDGGASLSNVSAYTFRNGEIELVEFHWELSHLSKFFNDNALAFAILGHLPKEHCAVPGKLMGFATMGSPRTEVLEWLKKNDFFKDCWEDKTAFYESARETFAWEGKLGDTRDALLQDIAACMQHTFEEGWLSYLEALQARVKAAYLYLSGGCALNIVANSRIVAQAWFKDVFIPPCPGDSGLSVGAAAFFEWKKHGKVNLHHPYMNNVGLPAQFEKYGSELIERVAQALGAGKIIGVANGAGELGPRALGNRSIIARPDSRELAEKVSIHCKNREWYRPIAPVMLEKHALRLTGQNEIHHLSKYMLLDFFIPQENRKEIEGVVHANGTARIQVIFAREDNPFIWDLLTCLDDKYDISALINTSFNRRGEPIVHTAEQALASAQSMELDCVLLDYQLKNVNKKEYDLETNSSVSRLDPLSE